MEIISHANALPWQIGTTFFMQLINQAISAVALLTITGLAYAGLHRLLSNPSRGTKPLPDKTVFKFQQDGGWNYPLKTKFQGGLYDET
jgi:hypothetical protein